MVLSSWSHRPPYGHQRTKIQLLEFPVLPTENDFQRSQETFFQLISVFLFQSPRNCKIQTNWIPARFLQVCFNDEFIITRRQASLRSPEDQNTVTVISSFTDRKWFPKFPGKLLPAHLRFSFSVSAKL